MNLLFKICFQINYPKLVTISANVKHFGQLYSLISSRAGYSYFFGSKISFGVKLQYSYRTLAASPGSNICSINTCSLSTMSMTFSQHTSRILWILSVVSCTCNHLISLHCIPCFYSHISNTHLAVHFTQNNNSLYIQYLFHVHLYTFTCRSDFAVHFTHNFHLFL